MEKMDDEEPLIGGKALKSPIGQPDNEELKNSQENQKAPQPSLEESKRQPEEPHQSPLQLSSYEAASSEVDKSNPNGNTELNQNVSSGGSESYDDEDDSGSDGSSSSSENDLEESSSALTTSTEYFFSMETQHKDFVRSMVQLGDNILVTASEDKTMKVFYFQY